MRNDFARVEFYHGFEEISLQMQAKVEFMNSQFANMMNTMKTTRIQSDEAEVYFYHSDHLGSASWITDSGGMAVQHLQYLPYGEPHINQRLSGYNERFTFTGKERDGETGFGYFGARYMDHELTTMWLSVDPMSDKYPSLSPYNYCAWNPVKLVDPDGAEFDPASQQYVEEYKRAIESKKNEMTTTREMMTELNAAIEEITELETSDQMYHITNVGYTYSREKGGIFYNPENNSISIEFDGKTASLAHELKHAYQFHDGKLSFNKSDGCFGNLYDKTDEIEALTRGGVFDIEQRETLRNVEYIYRFKVEKNTGGIDFHYPFLDKRPNSHCTVGNRSTSRTVSNADKLNIDLQSDYYRIQ